MLNIYKLNIGFILVLSILWNINYQIVYNKQLKLSNIIFRHGHRTPISLFPTSTHKYWPQGLGQLTNQGKISSFQLGQALANRYINDLKFISSTYNQSEILFQSSNADRCLMSAELVAAGLFPPNNEQIWNKSIAWQPIPIQTTPKYSDCMLRSISCHCPLRDILFLITLKNEKVISFEEKYKVFFELLSNYTGETVDLITTIKIYDELLIEKESNMSLPSWVADATLDVLSESVNFLHNITIRNPDINFKKILGGNLIWNIINNFKPYTTLHYNHYNSTNDLDYNFYDDDHSKKLYLYSAHDITLESLFNVIGIPIYDRIYYSAAILLELYIDDDKTPIIELYFRNFTDTFNKLPINNCTDKYGRCTLENFIRINQDVMTSSDMKICYSKNYSFPVHQSDAKYIVMIAMYVSTMLILIVLIILLARRHKGYSRLPDK